MAGEEGFELLEVTAGNGALGQHDDVDALHLVESRSQDTVEEAEVERFGRLELEDPEGLLLDPLHGPGHGRKSRWRTRSGHGSNRMFVCWCTVPGHRTGTRCQATSNFPDFSKSRIWLR